MFRNTDSLIWADINDLTDFNCEIVCLTSGGKVIVIDSAVDFNHWTWLCNKYNIEKFVYSENLKTR